MKHLIYLFALIIMLPFKVYCQENQDSKSHMNMAFFEIVGKNIKDEKVQRWFSTLDEPQKITKFKDVTLYVWKNNGISMSFDDNDTLTAIAIYPEGEGGYHEYKGELPFHLTFDLNKKERGWAVSSSCPTSCVAASHSHG